MSTPMYSFDDLVCLDDPFHRAQLEAYAAGYEQMIEDDQKRHKQVRKMAHAKYNSSNGLEFYVINGGRHA